VEEELVVDDDNDNEDPPPSAAASLSDSLEFVASNGGNIDCDDDGLSEAMVPLMVSMSASGTPG
jgi:hypothetical protein